MIYYITDDNGDVVGQFDGVEVELKDDHQRHEVESINDLPGVANWDSDYEV